MGNIGERVTAGTGVVSEEDLGSINRIEVQTGAGLVGRFGWTGRRE